MRLDIQPGIWSVYQPPEWRRFWEQKADIARTTKGPYTFPLLDIISKIKYDKNYIEQVKKILKDQYQQQSTLQAATAALSLFEEYESIAKKPVATLRCLPARTGFLELTYLGEHAGVEADAYKVIDPLIEKLKNSGVQLRPKDFVVKTDEDEGLREDVTRYLHSLLGAR